MRLMLRIMVMLASLLAVSGTAYADGPWSGYWATTWRDGGANLLLDQQGDHVTGTYPLYDGRVEAMVNGPRLEGRWFEGKNSGAFVFVMDLDGNSFSGRYDSGEWWTGARSATPDGPAKLDLSSPREVLRRFVVNGNIARSGRPDAWGIALLMADFGDAAPTMTRGEQLQRVQALFEVIDLTTFRVWLVPTEAPSDTLHIRLNQPRTGASFTLTMVRDDKGSWRIRLPSEDDLAAARRSLLAALGGQPATADAYKRLLNPRDTMRSFLEGMADWDGAGRALALSTLDVSPIPTVLRDDVGTLAAQYLRRVLNQVGLVGLQAIPNDGMDRTPYLHFSHPAGQVVIAPSGTGTDAPWKFTSQTVKDVADIYKAIEGLPPPLALPPGLIPDAPFFTLRDFVRVHAPGLLRRAGAVEYWQMIAFVMVIAGSTLIGMLGAWLIRRGTGWFVGEDSNQPRLFTWALAITISLTVASRFPVVLGVPAEVRQYAYPIFGVALTLAASIALWYILGVASVVLQRVADRTAAATDDILFTLLLAAARLGVVVAAFLGVAYFLSIPTNGILAGLGIGGLAFAFASRETLSNVFGAGILVADRPFRRGNWIKSGDIEGAVENVGIRSTRVRTAQDSILVVPNGKLADSSINNLGTRRHRLVKTQLLVTGGGTPERLDAFTAAVHQRITDDAAFVASRTEVGVFSITSAGVEVELSTYLDVSTSSAECAARHALLVDVLRLAETCGLILGPGTQTSEQQAAANGSLRC